MNVISRVFLVCSLGFVFVTFQGEAKEQVLFFEKIEPDAIRTVKLEIIGNQVSGSDIWQPTDGHGASGSLNGTIEGDRIHAKYDYFIEGSEQSEERIFKLQGDKLFIGEGELMDPEDNGHLVLKNAKNVTFENSLARVSVTEPAIGSPDRKAIMDAMRVPVAKQIGQPVEFTGIVRAAKDWASFSGNVATKDGKSPKQEDAQIALEMDFFALLKQTSSGGWEVKHSGFAGDIGVIEEAKSLNPKAPWVLFQ